MDHFPVFMAVAGRRIVLSGGADAALAKLRLILRTTANVTVVTANAAPEIHTWAATGRLTLIERAMEPGDAMCAVLFYAANEDDVEDGEHQVGQDDVLGVGERLEQVARVTAAC